MRMAFNYRTREVLRQSECALQYILISLWETDLAIMDCAHGVKCYPRIQFEQVKCALSVALVFSLA